MHFPKLFLHARIFAVVITLFPLIQARADKSVQTPSSGNDLFEISVGYNYLYLGDAYPETKNLHGFDISAFYNWNSWLGVGGDFMGDFGSRTVRPRFFLSDVDLDSQRYIYVFGPRFTLWQNSGWRLFAEALAGGVHAEASVTVQSGGVDYTRSESKDGFAGAVGAGFDWKFARHFSWRIIQADYVPTSVSSQWQHDFRASTGVVWSFGGH